MEKKKICIVTLTGIDNYGNRLQNIALQDFLEKHNFKVFTLWNSSYDSNKKFLKKKCAYLLREILYILKFFTKKSITHFKREKFNKKYVKIKKAFSLKSIQRIAKYTNYFLVGSDQVWNLDFMNFNYSFLNFVDKKKRITYGVSWGNYFNLDSNRKNFIEKYSNAEFTSVLSREPVPEFIKESKPHINYHTCLDPVFFFDKDYWIRKFHLNPTLKKDQIFVYKLGKENKKFNSIIENLLKEGEVLKYAHGDAQHNFDDCITSDIFIEQIASSKFILTNSFHAFAFSVIFGTRVRFYCDGCTKIEDVDIRIRNLLYILKMNFRLDTENCFLEPIYSSSIFETIKSQNNIDEKWLLNQF